MSRNSTGTRASALLTRAGVAFGLHPYHHDSKTASFGDEAVAALGLDAAQVFKTLIAVVDGRPACGVVPVGARLDLKALAAAMGAKRAELAEPAVAERVSGYVVGGISPLALRSHLPVVVDSSAESFETVYVSAGKRGLQVELSPADLITLAGAAAAPIARH